jgi:hypothetical protein
MLACRFSFGNKRFLQKSEVRDDEIISTATCVPEFERRRRRARSPASDHRTPAMHSNAEINLRVRISFIGKGRACARALPARLAPRVLPTTVCTKYVHPLSPSSTPITKKHNTQNTQLFFVCLLFHKEESQTSYCTFYHTHLRFEWNLLAVGEFGLQISQTR